MTTGSPCWISVLRSTKTSVREPRAPSYKVISNLQCLVVKCFLLALIAPSGLSWSTAAVLPDRSTQRKANESDFVAIRPSIPALQPMKHNETEVQDIQKQLFSSINADKDLLEKQTLSSWNDLFIISRQLQKVCLFFHNMEEIAHLEGNASMKEKTPRMNPAEQTLKLDKYYNRKISNGRIMPARVGLLSRSQKNISRLKSLAMSLREKCPSLLLQPQQGFTIKKHTTKNEIKTTIEQPNRIYSGKSIKTETTFENPAKPDTVKPKYAEVIKGNRSDIPTLKTYDDVMALKKDNLNKALHKGNNIFMSKVSGIHTGKNTPQKNHKMFTRFHSTYNNNYKNKGDSNKNAMTFKSESSSLQSVQLGKAVSFQNYLITPLLSLQLVKHKPIKSNNFASLSGMLKGGTTSPQNRYKDKTAALLAARQRKNDASPQKGDLTLKGDVQTKTPFYKNLNMGLGRRIGSFSNILKARTQARDGKTYFCLPKKITFATPPKGTIQVAPKIRKHPTTLCARPAKIIPDFTASGSFVADHRSSISKMNMGSSSNALKGQIRGSRIRNRPMEFQKLQKVTQYLKPIRTNPRTVVDTSTKHALMKRAAQQTGVKGFLQWSRSGKIILPEIQFQFLRSEPHTSSKALKGKSALPERQGKDTGQDSLTTGLNNAKGNEKNTNEKFAMKHHQIIQTFILPVTSAFFTRRRKRK